MTRMDTKKKWIAVLVGVGLVGLVIGVWLVFRNQQPVATNRQTSSQISGLRSESSQEPSRLRPTQPAAPVPLLGVDAEGALLAPPLPSSLADVLDFERKMPFKKRLEAVHRLPALLSAPESEALLAFVRYPRRPRDLSESQHLALVNDVLNVLQDQEQFHSQLRDTLLALFDDDTCSVSLRNYALQHLASLQGDGPGVDRSAHWRALSGSDPSLATTAMLHLLHASRQSGLTLAETDRLGQSALLLASNPATKAASRATALQVCGQLRLTEARETAYQIARSSKEPFPLRIAAIATLGDVGGDAEVTRFLKQTVNGPEKRLRVPAASALQRLEKKKES